MVKPPRASSIIGIMPAQAVSKNVISAHINPTIPPTKTAVRRAVRRASPKAFSKLI
jgi:hypothetical protein